MDRGSKHITALPEVLRGTVMPAPLVGWGKDLDYGNQALLCSGDDLDPVERHGYLPGHTTLCRRRCDRRDHHRGPAWSRLSPKYGYVRHDAASLSDLDLDHLVSRGGGQTSYVTRVESTIEGGPNLGREVVVKVQPQVRLLDVWVHPRER